VEIRDRAAPILRQLADEVSESVYLVVPDDDRVLYIYAIESSHRLQARSVLGDRAYYHSTAIGKAALAFAPSEVRERFLTSAELAARTKNTITKSQRLREELQVIRERGYSTDCEENEPRTFCVGAPVFGASGQLVAAASISGDTIAIVQDRRDALAEKLMRAAMEVSQHMGHVPTRSQLMMFTSV
jgi:IclR family acetate operon transcriptional repressor